LYQKTISDIGKGVTSAWVLFWLKSDEGTADSGALGGQAVTEDYEGVAGGFD
jgi:hypothetical protein